MTRSYELAPCPVCGTTASETIADGDAVRREVEVLWSFHGRRLKPETPPRFLLDRVVFSQAPPLNVVRCEGCGLLYRNPRESAATLHELYAHEDADRAVMASLFETQRKSYAAQATRLTEVCGRAGRGLEVGSYVGGFLAAARELGWDFEGLDVNACANAFARDGGFRVSDGELERFAPAGRFDAIAIWNCFEQLPDPGVAARRAWELLNAQGTLALRVPNGDFYASLRRRLDGPGSRVARLLLAHNNLLGFPYRHGFTLRSLAHILERVGFTIAGAYGDVLVPIADEWTRDWAALEERVVKSALRLLSGGDAEAESAPWLEIYATRDG